MSVVVIEGLLVQTTMKKLSISPKGYVLVDDEDYEFLSLFIWKLSKRGYAVGYIPMQRLLMRPARKLVVDHIDWNKLNNQKSNLRICTNSQNRMNNQKKQGTTSKFRGVYWKKNKNKFTAFVKAAGKNYWLGSFDDEHIAALMRDFWTTELHGEYAQTNFKVVSQWTNPKEIG